MEIKWIGAVLVMAGCGGFGASLAAAYRREEQQLRQLTEAIRYMECSLQYQLTPLPELCRGVSQLLSGPVRRLFQSLAKELEYQIAPDAASCMYAAVTAQPELMKSSRRICLQLGKTLGQFDLPGQLKGLEAAQHACSTGLEDMQRGRAVRLRSYQTLALCAGAALTIIFL